MIKQIVLILIISILAIFFKMELAKVLDVLVYLHNVLAKYMAVIFSNGQIGRLLQDLCALLLIPLIGGVVLALIFKLVKRSKATSVMSFVWVVWLVLLVTMIAQAQTTHMRASHPKNSAISSSV